MIKHFNKNLSKEEWLEERRLLGTGASEAAAILNVSEYMSAPEVYYMKLGLKNKRIRSEKMEIGLAMEPIIKEFWQYYDLDKNVYLDNIYSKNPVRKLKRVNAFCQNEEFPWLFASFDYMAPKGTPMIFVEGSPASDKDFPVQMKNTQMQSVIYWKNGIPLGYYIQCQQELLVSGNPYMEFAYMIDGSRIQVKPVYLEADIDGDVQKFGFDKPLSELILDQTWSFWYEHVLPARPLAERYLQLDPTKDVIEARELDEQIIQLMPSPGPSKAFEDFIKEQYVETAPDKTLAADYEHFLEAKAYEEAKYDIKQVESRRQVHKNNIIAVMGDAEKLDFGEDLGYVIYKRREGKKDYFRVKIAGSGEPDDE